MRCKKCNESVAIVILACAFATALVAGAIVKAGTDAKAEARPPQPSTSAVEADASKVAAIVALPYLDSSTSAQPLTMVTACERAGIEWHWGLFENDAGFEHRVYPGPKPKDGTSQGVDHPVHERFSTNGTHGAYVNLITMTRSNSSKNEKRYKADLILVARAPSKDEIKQAAKADIEYDVQPVALDAFVFIVHRSNPVESLTLDQIRSIYQHKTTRWKSVGGKEATIKAFRRDAQSGSEELMKRLVMKGIEMPEPAQNRIFHGMAGPINAMDHNEEGLAYTVYFYEKFMAARYWPAEKDLGRKDADRDDTKPRKRMRKVIAVDGVKPTFETLASRKYPLTTPVYVVIRKDTPADAPARKLRDWLLSAEGQKAVAKSGYVPVRVEKQGEG